MHTGRLRHGHSVARRRGLAALCILPEDNIAHPSYAVGVIGAGYAGMAAALALAQRGIGVAVYEASQRLGGRARAVVHRNTTLDNGQHLLIGAYRETLRLLKLFDEPDDRLLRLPLQWRIAPEFSFRAAKLPAPWHLAVGLLRSSGVSLSARLGCIRLLARCRKIAYTLGQDVSVAALLRDHRQDPSVVRLLWEPLCLAALNTPIERASAQVFLNVLRDSLGADREASELILPRCDLSTLFPEPAARHVQMYGGEVRLGDTVQHIERDADAFTLRTTSGQTRHRAVILASQPSRVASLAGHLAGMAQPVAQIAALTYEPIITIYLQYAQAPRLPLAMTGLAGGHIQWLFDRDVIAGQRGLIAAVISARGHHSALSHAALAQRAHTEIATVFPPLDPPQWTQVIEEKRATFAACPNLVRPDQRTPVPGLFLAGDYTRGDYPATLEAAVRSGLRCAELAFPYVRPNASNELTRGHDA